jgi:hypothetical protein
MKARNHNTRLQIWQIEILEKLVNEELERIDNEIPPTLRTVSLRMISRVLCGANAVTITKQARKEDTLIIVTDEQSRYI